MQRAQQLENDPDPLGHYATGTKCGYVLNVEEVDAIHNDIACLIRPSWLMSVPAQLGNASHGKLKADQWRALGTTFLPISLVHLWSDEDESNQRSVRCLQILDVTMSLLSAVILATSRTTSSDHIDQIQGHLLDYLNGLKQVFPDYKLHPNHHMSLHIPEYIKLFGPVHAWWAFPFERVVGMLQRNPSNYKSGNYLAIPGFHCSSATTGEYESTIAHSFVRANNLRNIFRRAGTPEVIRHCEPMFE